MHINKALINPKQGVQAVDGALGFMEFIALWRLHSLCVCFKVVENYNA